MAAPTPNVSKCRHSPEQKTKPILVRLAALEAKDPARNDLVTQLYRAYSGLILKIAMNKLSFHDAQDVLQQVIFEVNRNAANYNESIGKESAWISTITYRRVRDVLRKLFGEKGGMPRLVQNIDDWDCQLPQHVAAEEEDPLVADEEVNNIISHIDQLKPLDRALMKLVVDQVPFAEMATHPTVLEVANRPITKSYVSGRLTQARKKLRVMLG